MMLLGFWSTVQTQLAFPALQFCFQAAKLSCVRKVWLHFAGCEVASKGSLKEN